MSSLNVVALVGNVGKEPRFSPPKSEGGMAVAKFSVATNEFVKKEKVSQWHNVVVFGRQAEIVNEFVKKGTKIGIQGRLSSGSYDKEGKTVYYTEVLANRVSLLSSKPKDNAPAPSLDADDIPF